MSNVQVNKRLLYVFAFLFVAIPVLVGVLVWHFTDSSSTTTTKAAQTSSADTPSPSHSTTPPAITTPKPPTPEEIAAKPWLGLRLPSYQLPIHYDLTLYPDIYSDSNTFYGNETVEIQVLQPTKFLLLHVLKLHIHDVKLYRGQNRLDVANSFEYSENQFLVVEAQEIISNGSKVLLKVRFSGALNESIVGFYKSKYVNSKTGETRYLASTKFEPVNARRAFPCMDEPNLKAEYTVTLIHRLEYTALSNMPPAGELHVAAVELVRYWSVHWPHFLARWFVEWARLEHVLYSLVFLSTGTVSDREDLLLTKFQKSVKMSTYLVCFIVCDFKYIEDYTSSGTRVRVYSAPDKIDQTQFALQVGVHSMLLYEVLFNVSYPLPKQDMIAIPDFVSGAMENWGLITFREVRLLYNPKTASVSSKQSVALTVAHEISHQWFGNLVTMDWWNDLWLNEGFATFMEYIAVDSIEPSWNMMSQFVTFDVQRVMKDDAGVASHPIVVPVNSPSEINEVFDAISYRKGSAVIRMIEHIMGKDNFFSGVSAYLKRYAWGNAKTDDLWGALSEVKGAPPVKHIMDTWTLQMGYPVVSINFTPSKTGSTTATTTSVTATQTRFLADPDTVYNENESPFKYKWYVSLDCRTSANQISKQVLDLTDVTFELSIDTGDSSSWVKCNLDQNGYYRVNYPPANWRKLSQMLRTTDVKDWPLSDSDRSSLLDDAINLAQTGLLGYDVAMEMTSYLHKENSFIAWNSVYSFFTYISSMLTFDKDFGVWREFVISVASPHLNRLGWKDDGSHVEKRLRLLLIDLVCKHDEPNCLAQATAKFRDWLDKDINPPVDLKSMVYKWGMWAGGTADDWDKLWNKYLNAVAPQEKLDLMRALAMTRTPWLLGRLLDYAKTDEFIRRQDFVGVVAMVAVNPAGRGILWDWLQRNWEAFVKRFTLFDRYFGRAVPYTVATFNTQFDKDQVLAFFKKYPEAGSGARGRKQAVEKIGQNIHWMTHFKPTLVEWLRNRP